MVIDTSAVVAILFGEEDQIQYAEAIESAITRLVSRPARLLMPPNGAVMAAAWLLLR
jgi:uncharacterized protein with PIN domain